MSVSMPEREITQTGGSAEGTKSSDRPVVLIHQPIRSMPWSYEVERRIFADRGVDMVEPADEAANTAALADAEVVIACDTLTGDQINAIKRPAGIVAYSVGMDYIDQKAAAARGIPIWNCPTHNSEEVSDHAVTLLLAGNKRLLDLANAAAAGNWDIYNWPQLQKIHRMRGHTVGFVGMGRIGHKIARKLHGFGLRAIAYDPYINYTPDPWIDLVSLDDVLTRSNFIICAASLTDTSRGLLDEAAFGKVTGLYGFVNISRGGVVVESALKRALDEGRIGFAALDVRSPEPPDPSNDLLTGRSDVLLTQHIAASSIEAQEDIHTEAANQAITLLELAGRLPKA
jgi:D-3-phosphoglycerate dehydrogenase